MLSPIILSVLAFIAAFSSLTVFVWSLGSCERPMTAMVSGGLTVALSSSGAFLLLLHFAQRILP